MTRSETGCSLHKRALLGNQIVRMARGIGVVSWERKVKPLDHPSHKSQSDPNLAIYRRTALEVISGWMIQTVHSCEGRSILLLHKGCIPNAARVQGIWQHSRSLGALKFCLEVE